MSRLSNGRLIKVDGSGRYARDNYGGLSRHPISKRIEAQASRLMREALRRALSEAMAEAADAPRKTGVGIRSAITGARAFGTSFSTLRGHITAIGRMVAHENSTEVLPQNEYLAVPIYDGLRADGTPKLKSPGQWRQYGSFVFKSKKTGRMFIVRDVGGELQFLYVLLESAQLRKHGGWASKAWSKKIPQLIAEWDSIVASFMTVGMVEEAFSGRSR